MMFLVAIFGDFPHRFRQLALGCFSSRASTEFAVACGSAGRLGPFFLVFAALAGIVDKVRQLALLLFFQKVVQGF